jgi:signal transduction histidine kinase/CheY-like chemotaxis protein
MRKSDAKIPILNQSWISEHELIETVFRYAVTSILSLCLAWYLVSIFSGLWIDLPKTSQLILLVVIFSWIGLWMQKYRPTFSRVFWLLGLGLAVLFGLYLFQLRDITLLFAVLPLLATVILLQWIWGLITEALVVGVMLLLSGHFGIQPAPDIATMMPGILGAFLMVIGWGLSASYLDIARWAVTNYRKASQDLDEMRDERVRLLEVQEDYRLMNNEMARLTDRLAAMQQTAEDARRVKEDFVARVSHELRTPLNMIIGFSEIMMKSPQLYGESIPSSLLADISSIYRNSTHLSKLVDDVLDLSQVEAGRMALIKEWISLEEIIDEAVSGVQALFVSKGLYLEVQIPADLPKIFCDATRIRQVIINLLGNSARFTEEGGIKILTVQEGDWVRVSVADTGPGISAENQKKIFEPFQQVDTILRRHKGGSGLGLTISKNFVEMHGGRMGLESHEGEGTTFYFSLPIKSPVSIMDEAGDQARRWFNPYYQYEARPRNAKAESPVKISRYVILEGEETLQRILTRYMEGVEITNVRDISDALTELKRSPAQALIVNTPLSASSDPLSGHINDVPFGTPVITCWVPGKEEAVMNLGVVDYLIKPVSHVDLDSAIQQACPQARSILLVDDEPEIVRLFIRLLSAESHNYQVFQAMNGNRAMQLMREHVPDLVLLDLMMPDMDGVEVLQEKSQDPLIRDIPVIAVSSRNPRGDTNISRSLTVIRKNGLSAQELISCIQDISRNLAPSVRSDGQVQIRNPGG